MTMKLRFALIVVLAFSVQSASGSPLNNGGPVFVLDTGNQSGIHYLIYRDELGWLLKFYSDDSKAVDVYYDLAKLGAEGKLEAVITLDFQPALDCRGEYDILLKERHYPEESQNGFSILLKGIKKWDELDFSRLMVHFDSKDVNKDRCPQNNR